MTLSRLAPAFPRRARASNSEQEQFHQSGRIVRTQATILQPGEEACLPDNIFFGYASTPPLSRETLHRAAEAISQLGPHVQSWGDLRIGGRLVISSVLSAIDEPDLSIFDVSTLSPNVLFELGYAIGRARRIWILLDRTDNEARARWNRFRLLSSVGGDWANSDDIRRQFLIDQPLLADKSIHDDLIELTLKRSRAARLSFISRCHTLQTPAS